jgi:hypothetical protein
MFKITDSKPFFYGLVFAATLSVGVARAQSTDDQNQSNDMSGTAISNYCHKQFPAIRPNTLGTNHPQLEDPDSGDMIDYYGPCDHDPLGKDEVQRQEHDQLVGGLRNFGGM